MSSIAKRKQTLLSITSLTAEQQKAIDRVYTSDHTMLIANMGAGKTVIALTAINEMINDGELDRVLIFAPLKVCQSVWRSEALKWDHTQHLSTVFCTGSPQQRVKIIAEAQKTKGILLINFDLMHWFFSVYKKTHGFQGLVIDELSKLKAGGAGFKKMKHHLDSFKWRVGMTGTPCAEDFEGLFYQTYTLDIGDRFGTNKQRFLNEYFYPTDYQQYNWALKPDGAERITSLLSDLVYTVPDYRSELPKLNSFLAYVALPPGAREIYDDFAKTCVLRLDSHPDQSADNAAVLSGKLQQLASGNIYIYDDFGEQIDIRPLHKAKIVKCKILIESLGEPVILCYWYKHELASLEKAFPNAVNLNEEGAMERWNNGEVDILLMQPMSASHGIQLQFGGRNLIFVSPVWSNDLVEQTIARIWRKGQTQECNIWEIIALNTVDELIVDRVSGKKKFDEIFHDLIGGKIEK